MRRPPDSGYPNASERDVVSSNATLAVFGGGRRKSWMMGAGAPVRPTPRTNIARAAVPPLVQMSTASILPSPAPSDEPSPILPNAHVSNSISHPESLQEPSTNGHHNTSALAHTLFTGDAAPMPAEADIQAEEARRGAQLPTALSYQPQYGDQRSLTISPRDQNPSTRRMSSGLAALPNASEEQQQRVSLAQHAQPNDHPGLGRPRSQLESVPQRQAAEPGARSSTDGSQWPQVFLPGPMLGRGISSPGTGQLPSPSQTNTAPPPTNSEPYLPPHVLQQARSYPSPSSAASAPPNSPKRQRTRPPSMPSLKPSISMIHKQIASIGGPGNLNNGLERPRFQLLEDACRNEDLFYVVLHQLFCIWDLPDPAQVASIQGFPSSNTLVLAFKLLGQLIRENEGLAPNHGKWFTKFPGPLHDLLRTSEPYRRAVGDVGFFLGKLASEWGQLSKDCAARQYPPLVDELVNRLGLLSPILQGVVFTAARRNLGVTDDHVGRKMEELHRKDRLDYQTLAARRHTTQPPTVQELQNRNRILTNDYFILLGQQILSRRSSGSSTPNAATHISPNVPISSGHFQPGLETPLNIPGGTQARHNPGPSHIMGPDMAGNWQSVDLHSAIRNGSTSSPNMTAPAIAGRSPSLNGPHLQTGTPSPTLLQGLSIQSPVQMQQGFAPVLRSNGHAVQHLQDATGFTPGNPNGRAYQTPYQAVDPNTLRNIQYQQMQHHPPAQNLQYQVSQHPIAAQIDVLAQQQQPPQVPVQMQPFQLELLRQNQMNQRLLLQHQHSQQQRQQVISMNRAAQIRGEGGEGQQTTHSRTNSITSIGRQTPNPVPSNVPPQRNMTASRPRPENLLRPVHPLDRPFIPPIDMVPIQQQVNPDATALHQAHLRSPVLTVPEIFPDSQDAKSGRYYQIMKDFALGPVKIPMEFPIADFQFSVSAAHFACLPTEHSLAPGQPPTRELKSGTLQYRLRCIQTRPEVTICLAPDWIVSDTVWPESVFPLFNEENLDIRRKVQHGKDLPIDVTQCVARAGPDRRNQIRISMPKWRHKKDQGYFLAVEMIETLRHKEIMRKCMQQRIPASQTLESIKQSLAPKNDDDDDDLAMVPGDLTVSLADPFTARIFVTPVRGMSCRHRECFDLETFLLTRNSKPKRSQQPCIPDVWKCPLCGKDARPYSLQIDEFLLSVRAELEKQNKLDVKAILISPDGNWRAKPEPRPEKRKAPYDDDFSEDEEEEQLQLQLQQQQETNDTRAAVVEVIELDDD